MIVSRIIIYKGYDRQRYLRKMKCISKLIY